MIAYYNEVTSILLEVVFCDEFIGDVSKLDTGVLLALERGVEVEVRDIEDDKLGAPAGQDTVDDLPNCWKAWGSLCK